MNFVIPNLARSNVQQSVVYNTPLGSHSVSEGVQVIGSAIYAAQDFESFGFIEGHVNILMWKRDE